MLSAEQAARQNIDRLLQMAGWHVCEVAAADIHAACGVAIREFPLTAGFGFVDYLLTIKDAEIARFQTEVTEWEQREYFEMF